MPSVHQLHTSCKTCIFALYKDIEQIGCKINKLQKWKDSGLQILEVYDETKEFYVINDICCPYNRNTTWGKAWLRDEWIEIVEREVRFKQELIIIANDNLSNLGKTVIAVNSLTEKPEHISIIRMFDNKLPPREIRDILDTVNKIPWEIRNMVNSEYSEAQSVDSVIINCPYHYYSVFHAGFVMPPNTFTEIDSMIKNAKPFNVLLPNSTGNGFVAHVVTHKLLRGSKGHSLDTKIQELGKECKKQIQTINEVCPNFPK